MTLVGPKATAHGKPWFYDGTLLGWATYLEPEVVELYAALAAHGARTLSLVWSEHGTEEWGGQPESFVLRGVAVVSVDQDNHRLVCVHPEAVNPFQISTERVHSICLDW